MPRNIAGWFSEATFIPRCPTKWLMARLNIERQGRLEPERIAHAVRRIEQLGYTITLRDNKKIQFIHKGKTVTFFPYSGWATGKTIQDGRGLDKLIKQLKN